MLPHMFIIADTEPAKPPPVSRGMAQETPTVSSRAKKAMQLNQMHVVALAVNCAGTVAAPASTNPKIATPRRASGRLPERLAQISEIHPPSRSPKVPASSGRLE